LRLIH